MVPPGRLVVVTLGGAERVAMTPPKFVPVPTASQLTGLAHPTPANEATPEGADCGVHPLPPSVVVMIVAPPTAVHVETLMQLIDSMAVDPTGVPRSFQVVPPFVVLITWEPVAKQVVSLGHETPSRLVTRVGGVCGIHVAPPFVVPRITACGPPDEAPTAVQWVAPGQEIPVKVVTIPG
jgi:hypothetical protein